MRQIRQSDQAQILVDVGSNLSVLLTRAHWTSGSGHHALAVVIDARNVRFQHADFKAIVRSPQAVQLLDICAVERNHVGVAFVHGEYVETLPPGQYAWCRGITDANVV